VPRTGKMPVPHSPIERGRAEPYDVPMPQETTPPRGVYTAEVVENRLLCENHYLLTVRAAGLPSTRPGQFVQLQCRPIREQVVAREANWPPGEPPRLSQPELADREPFLRRPFSLAGRRDGPGGAELDLIYLRRGAGTRWLAEEVKPGERLSLLGPLGNGFQLRPGRSHAALVGGGVGIPPMMHLADSLSQAGVKAVAFCGARGRGLLPLTLAEGCAPAAEGEPTLCVSEFARSTTPSVVTTDDGSLGMQGLVSVALERWLDANTLGAADVTVYCCGPEPMMRAVGGLCAGRGIECQHAMERHMACGMGTCQSCVVKIADQTPRGWSYKLCCTDGPVFDSRSIVWE